MDAPLVYPFAGCADPVFFGSHYLLSVRRSGLGGSASFLPVCLFQYLAGLPLDTRQTAPPVPGERKSLCEILAICLLSGLYGASIAGLLFLVWTKLSPERFSAATFLRFIAFSSFAVVIFTLLYEVLYLSKEREMEGSRADRLDKEKALAELQALHNELDPHFVFNSLTSLSYLIRNDPEKAMQFDHKLAQVFRYFLLNKTHGLVPLEKELAFVDDYLYLLRIRYEANLQVQIRGREEAGGYVVPCSLQLLLENAIKHNAFSKEHPLCIVVEVSATTICVSNNRQPKISSLPSTKIGLANLDQRYRLVFQQGIAVEKSSEGFRVCLPVIPLTAMSVPAAATVNRT